MPPNWRRTSEHRVLIRSLFRDLLQHVPMLDDLAILQPENVDHRRAARPLCRNHVAVNSHKIALSDESLELDAQIWVLASDPFHKADERLRAVTSHGVVLAIRRPDVLLHGFLGLSLVEGEVVKGFDVGLVLVRAGHGSLLKLLKWSTTEERTSEENPRLPNSARRSSMKFQWPCSNRKLVGHRRSKPASIAGRRFPPSRPAMMRG